MTVAGPGGNRNSKDLPVGPAGRPWSFDLFDCFGDAGTCLFFFFRSVLAFSPNRLSQAFLRGFALVSSMVKISVVATILQPTALQIPILMK